MFPTYRPRRLRSHPYSFPGERLPIGSRERVREGGSEGEILIGNLRAERE